MHIRKGIVDLKKTNRESAQDNKRLGFIVFRTKYKGIINKSRHPLFKLPFCEMFAFISKQFSLDVKGTKLLSLHSRAFNRLTFHSNIMQLSAFR
jgi:hypothetical protein